MRAAALLGMIALLGVGGCTPQGKARSDTAGRDLTPDQFGLLTPQEQIRYKNVVIRVPVSMGGSLLPFDKGPYASPLDRSIHTGDLDTLMGLYNQSMFEIEHPRVKVDFINFDMWSDNYKSALAVALSAGTAPSYYVARDLPQTIEQGMYADITPLIDKWDQKSLLPEYSLRQGTYNGKHYVICNNELSALVIRYRKDWFREAGIFNEKGEPGPPLHWTWEDFRRIAKRLTDPSRGRYGFADMMRDWIWNDAHDLELYVPDPTGKHTWTFNAADPRLKQSLQAVREMYTQDKSVDTSVSMGWSDWHSEFTGGHAAMITSWAAHLPKESLSSPQMFGKDKPYGDTVGMAEMPRDEPGLPQVQPICDNIGFDPTLSPAQLEAAFEWTKSRIYGDIFINNMRNAAVQARIHHRNSTLYAEVLCLPFKPTVNLLDRPLESIFPPDYLRVYGDIRATHLAPLPREFGITEPPTSEFEGAVNALYQEALTTNNDLDAIIAKTKNLIDGTMLNFRGKDDAVQLKRWIDAKSAFYKQYYPAYFNGGWQKKLQSEYNLH